MNALRCNRCQGYFVPEEEEGKLMTVIPEMFLRTGEEVRRNIFSERITSIDLCPECTREHQLFMDGCSLRIDENSFDAPDIP